MAAGPADLLIKPGDLIRVPAKELDGCWGVVATVITKDMLVNAVVTDVRPMTYRSRKNKRALTGHVPGAHSNPSPALDDMIVEFEAECSAHKLSCGRPGHNASRHRHNTRASRVVVVGDLTTQTGVDSYLNGPPMTDVEAFLNE